MRVAQRGFTIVELVVVIAIIGVLSTVAFLGLSGFQASARDQQRMAKATTIAEALEKYYNANGEYPAVTAVTNTTGSVVASKIDVPAKTLILPTDTATNSITTLATPTTAPAKNKLGYVGYIDTVNQQSTITGCAGDASGNGGCDGFDLKFLKEEDGSTQTVPSRRGERNLLAVSTALSQPITVTENSGKARGVIATASCSEPSVAQYQQRYRINNGSSWDSWRALSAWSTSPNYSTSENISQGYRYEFDGNIRCYNNDTQVPSPAVAATTGSYLHPINKPSAPIASVNPSGSGYADSATWSWSASPCGALSTEWHYYKYQTNTANVGPTSLTTNSYSTSTSAQGYAFGAGIYVRCYNGNTTSPWSDASNNPTYTRAIPAPTSAPYITNNGAYPNTSWNWNSNGLTCPAGASVQYNFEYGNNQVAGGGMTYYYGIYANPATTTYIDTTTTGVRYNVRVSQFCRGPATDSATSGWGNDATFYRPIQYHIFTTRVIQRLDPAAVTPSAIIEATNAACSQGHVKAQFKANVSIVPYNGGLYGFWRPGFQDSTSFTVPTMISSAVDGSGPANYSSSFYQRQMSGYFNFDARCINAINGEVVSTDPSYPTQANSSLYRTYGVFRTLENFTTKWRMTCQANEECDNYWTVNGATGVASPAGCNVGTSSNVYNMGSTTWTGDCG